MMLSESSSETKKRANAVAKKVLKKEGPFVFSLTGNLGGGKTTFVQGLAKGLGIKEDITSPTFVIYKKYKAKKGKVLYHFDAYRVGEEDLLELGLKEISKDKNNVVVIEWGEKARNILPEEKIEIEFNFLAPRKRQLIVKDKGGIITGV